MFTLQSEIELMKLRSESHEERYKNIDKEMEEMIDKKVSGQKKELLKKLWKEECILEEIRSRERWENSNVKWTEKYETAFTKFYETRSPFIWDEQFFPPNIRNQKGDQTQHQQQQQQQQQQQPQQQQQQRQQENNTINRTDRGPRNDEDVIITGVSTNPGSTLIGKQVRFNNPITNQPKPNFKNPSTIFPNKNRPPLLNNPPSQTNFGTYNQGMQNQNTYSGMNINTGFKPNQPRPTQYRNYNPSQNRKDFLYQGPTPYTNP